MVELRTALKLGISRLELVSQPQPPSLVPIILQCFRMAGIAIAVWTWGYLGFSVSWVFLVLFFHVAGNECRKIKESKMAYARQAVLNEREAIEQRVDEHSSWVYFPEIEKAEWVNKLVKQTWPFVGEYVRVLLRENFEQSISDSLPENLKPFKFDTIELGDDPPRIDYVKVYTGTVKRDEIVCDIELRYFGDADIEVSLKALTAGVKDLQVCGTLRLIIKPLVSELPIIGALSIFFLNKPKIDFTLTGSANILDAPGISKSLRACVEDQVARYVVLPNRIVVSLSDKVDTTSLKYPLPQGVIVLHMIEGKEIKMADHNIVGKSKSDPYCQILIGANMLRTKTKKNTVDPVWDENFEAIVDQKHGQVASVYVFDEDPGKKDDALGNATIYIETVAKQGFIETWIPLEDVKTGRIHVRAMWMYLTTDLEYLAQTKRIAESIHIKPGQCMSSALLVATVIEAKDIPAGTKRKRSAYVCLTTPRLSRKTEIMAENSNPRWDANFQFLLGDPLSEHLTVLVMHHGQVEEKRLGQFTVPMDAVVMADNMTIHKEYPLVECGANTTITLRLCVRILSCSLPPDWYAESGSVTADLMDNATDTMIKLAGPRKRTTPKKKKVPTATLR